MSGGSAHRWVMFHGWLTFCARCRLVRLRNEASEAAARRSCRAGSPDRAAVALTSAKHRGRA